MKKTDFKVGQLVRFSPERPPTNGNYKWVEAYDLFEGDEVRVSIASIYDLAVVTKTGATVFLIPKNSVTYCIIY